MVDYNLDKRKYVIGGVAIAIVVIYAIRLFTLQIMSEDYKKNADSNAFLKQIEFPSRGAIFSIGWIINLLLIYLMIVGIKNALNDKWEPLPYIGKFKLF